MAIRSTNANRASKAYNPTAKPASGTGNFGRQNTDGPGNTPVDYGQRPPGSQSKQQQWDRRVEDYGLSPWFASGDQMPWSGPDNQRGQRTPFYTPDAGDPRNAGYFKSRSPEWQAAWDAQHAQDTARRRAVLESDDAWMAAKNAGDRKGQMAAEVALKKRMEQQRFIDQGGTAETWQNRFKTEWPVPKSPLGTSTHNPNGSPPASRPPAAVGYPPISNPAPQAAPPSANPMFEGYQSGALGGQFPGGSPMGSLGGNPMSKSGMGQSPMSGPAMSTGNPMGGMVDQSLRLGGGQVPPWARGQMPSGPVAEPAMVSGGGWWNQGGGYNPMMGGGGMGGMGFGGFGGFNPMLGGGMGMGYNPGAQFSPVRYMMMGGY